MGRSRKPLYPQGYPGFESLSLRHFFLKAPAELAERIEHQSPSRVCTGVRASQRVVSARFGNRPGPAEPFRESLREDGERLAPSADCIGVSRRGEGITSFGGRLAVYSLTMPSGAVSRRKAAAIRALV